MEKKIFKENVFFNTMNCLVMSLFIFICIYPFYYLFIYSISDPEKAMAGIAFLPIGFSMVNYQILLKLQNITNAFIVSASRTVLGTIITILCSSFFAYLVSINCMWFRKAIYRFAIITMYFNAGIIPWYMTMKAIGLKDNFLLYIIPSALVSFYVILLKTYIEQIPISLSESAMLDGAGVIKIFAVIIFPLSKPIIATVAVFAAVGQWNSWFDNLLLVTNPNLQTLQIILYQYLNYAQSLAKLSMLELAKGNSAKAMTSQSVQVTITLITTFPILIVYPFLQRFFVKGIMLGAIKS